MGLETNVDKVSDLNDAWPLGTDPKSQGDDHIRFCKKAMLSGDFSGIDLLADAITASGALTGDTVSDSIGDLRAAIEQALSQANNPNLIINGDMSVWQRGASGTAPVGGAYTADRWSIGASYAWSRVNGTGQFPYALQIPLFAIHPIELPLTGNAGTFQVGETFTLSFFANAAQGQDISYSMRFADDGQLTNGVIDVATTVIGTGTGSFEKYEATFTVSASPLGTNKCYCVLIYTGGTGSFTGVKLERGSVATPFIPDDPATNLAKCQRYFEAVDMTNLGIINHHAGNTNAHSYTFSYNTKKRVTPIVTQLSGGWTVNATSQPTFSAHTNWGFRFDTTPTDAGASMQCFGSSGGCVMAIDAEL